jgi:hypothetical protein
MSLAYNQPGALQHCSTLYYIAITFGKWPSQLEKVENRKKEAGSWRGI